MRNSPGSLLRRATPPAAKGKRPGLSRPTLRAFLDRSGVGPFTCNGDRTPAPASPSVSGGDFTDSVVPHGDVRNPPIGAGAAGQVTSPVNTLGHDADVFGPPGGFRSNDNQSAARLVSHRDAARAGVLFVAADIRP
ncbi:hypothetical protein ACIP2X_33205 [Streptomyces sp. NPDC089424]|uniref:hypothetical protein n=1 Tax=Streptomyces sp. NPDC089424 TaxID=3365917 RepID=UPI00381DB1FE